MAGIFQPDYHMSWITHWTLFTVQHENEDCWNLKAIWYSHTDTLQQWKLNFLASIYVASPVPIPLNLLASIYVASPVPISLNLLASIYVASRVPIPLSKLSEVFDCWVVQSDLCNLATGNQLNSHNKDGFRNPFVNYQSSNYNCRQSAIVWLLTSVLKPSN